MPEYSKKIVDHFTHPRNTGELEGFDVKAFIGNPVCGDQIHLFARVEHERIVACSFLGYGCAASLASCTWQSCSRSTPRKSSTRRARRSPICSASMLAT